DALHPDARRTDRRCAPEQPARRRRHPLRTRSRMTEQSLAIEMRRITKKFPGVVANDQVDLEVRKGEIHALVGENGAGKSTLMNILYGLIEPDVGQIVIDAKPVVMQVPRD